MESPPAPAPSTPRPAPAPIWRASLAPVVLAAWCLGSSLLFTPFHVAGQDLAYFAPLYLLLGTTLHLGVRFGLRLGSLGACAAAGVAGFVLAAQQRLDGEILSQTPFFLLASVLFSAAIWFLSARVAGPLRVRSIPRGLAGLYLAAGATVGLAALGYQSSEALRWHLLHHHRLFGIPAYTLGSRSITAEREALWRESGRAVDPWERRAEQAGEPLPPAEGAPHVIFLLVDTLRADGLAAWGGDPGLMPVTNALAERSLVLRDVQSNASWTRASCASIFTGLRPEEHGAARFHERLPEDWETMAEKLHDAGYQTGAFVSNWVQVGKDTGFAQGFETFAELSTSEEVLSTGKQEIRDLYARAETVNGAALDWLASDERREASAGRPVFLYLHYLDPHAPYMSGAEPGTEDATPRERKWGHYRQELKYFDAELGRFLARLDEVLPGRKAIVLTSDHGEEFWEHGEWGHGHALYKELVWVPAFVHLDGGGTGISQAPLESRDLFDLVCHVARPGPTDLAVWAAGRARDVRYASQYLDRVADVRPDKKWTAMRLIEQDGHALIWSGYGPSLEVYDRSADPAELSNIVDEDRERTGRLRRSLDDVVDFWTRSLKVMRSADDLEMLRALGYAGGVDEP